MAIETIFADARVRAANFNGNKSVISVFLALYEMTAILKYWPASAAMMPRWQSASAHRNIASFSGMLVAQIGEIITSS